MKITIAQLNPVVGDIEGNLAKLTEAMKKAVKDSSDLLVLSELFLVGYPPRDLLEKPYFIKRTQEAINQILKLSLNYPDTGILLGCPIPSDNPTGKGLYNSALLIYQGRIILKQHKSLLPNYDVFDEERYFDNAGELHIIPFKDEVLGVSICEDAWNDPELWPKKQIYDFNLDDDGKVLIKYAESHKLIYDTNPIALLAKKGATLFINISASPFYMGKEELRYKIISNHAKKHNLPFVYVNQTGGNDEIIFDGRSMCFNKDGEPVLICPSFKEYIHTIDMNSAVKCEYSAQDKIESVHDALILGIKDYISKCGFSKAVIGLSGGIDSALTAYLAVKAIGNENVLGISMPSPYSSKGSVDDSLDLAKNLNIEFKTISISSVYFAYIDTLKEHFIGKEEDVTEENIQARIRGNTLMAFSNKFGNLVLSTGNKSEMAVGYCTLYGDMCGGLSVLADVPKTMVYELSEYINRDVEIIPNSTIKKAPSAELRPNQVDQDTLPPYPVLDQILNYYIEENLSTEDIINLNITSPDVVKWVIKTVNRNEYKRKQAAPGLKVTSKAFGAGRRMPLAAKYSL